MRRRFTKSPGGPSDARKTVLEAMRIIKEQRPDLVLSDIALPDRTGIELTGEFKKVSANTIVMIVSMHSKVDYIAKAFQAGATGYVTKDSAAERLLHGTDAVLRGEYFLATSVSLGCQKVRAIPSAGACCH